MHFSFPPWLAETRPPPPRRPAPPDSPAPAPRPSPECLGDVVGGETGRSYKSRDLPGRYSPAVPLGADPACPSRQSRALSGPASWERAGHCVTTPPRPLAPQPHPSQAQGSHRDAAGAWLERHFSLEGVGPLPDLPGKPGGTAHPVPETWLLRERGMWPLELPLVPRRLGPGWRPLRTATENPATPPHPWSHPVPAGAALVTRGGRCLVSVLAHVVGVCFCLWPKKKSPDTGSQ